jgi:hypothetical protein
VRNSTIQRGRTRNNPLNLGTFSQTSLRYLKGSLGPQNQLIGRSDTGQTSNGGFGGGTYNHWFKIGLAVDAWIITTKGPPRPKYIQVSAYDLNNNPIEGRGIFDADSVPETIDGQVYYPYVGQVMNAQSDLYNNFNPARLDKGDDRYFTLPPGEYLLCISSTRNEPLDYAVGLVIEVPDLEPNLLLETWEFLTYEDSLEDFISLDLTENYTGFDEHIHSLLEWQMAWAKEHQQFDRFPDVFIPLTNTP